MIWVSLQQASQLYGITPRAVLKRVRSGGYTARRVKGRGGERYEIALMGNDEKQYTRSEEPHLVDCSDLNTLPGYIRDYIMEFELVFSMTAGMSGAEVARFVREYKPKCPHIKLSRATYYRKRAQYNALGRAGIAPAWGSGGTSSISNEQLEYFKNIYLKERGPSAEKCRVITYGWCRKQNQQLSISGFPTAKAFLARMAKTISPAFVNYARKGERYYKRNHEYFIARDWSDIAAGEWWVSDHHQLDVLCTDKYGDTVRPWATVWMDLRTDKFVGWWLHPEAPNSDHIFMTLAWGVEKYGLPGGAYLDNGKDYRSIDLTGNPKRYRYWNDESEHKARCLFNTFDIKVIFAREYNAQAKPIEPRFRQVIAGFSKIMPGYTGSDTATRPDSLKMEVAQKKLMPFDEVQRLFDDYVENTYNNTVSDGSLLCGLSPNQAWEKYCSAVIRKPSAESMRQLYMRGKTTTIGRRGIVERFNGVEMSWWADEFYALRGTKVYVTRDVRAYQKAYVYDARSDAFLCVALMDSRMPGIVTDIDKTELREAIKRKNKDLRVARDAVKTAPVDAREILENEKIAVVAIAEENNGSVAASADRTEVVVTTDFDRIRKEVQEKMNRPAVDMSEITPDVPLDVYEDIDVWGLKSVNAY